MTAFEVGHRIRVTHDSMRNPSRPINGITGRIVRVAPVTPGDQVDIEVVHGNDFWKRGQECPVLLHEMEHVD